MTRRPRIAVAGLVGRSIFFEVRRFHEGGETIHATGSREEWGGKGFNQAVAAARQGAAVSFLGKAGCAADAAAIAAVCKAEGIEPFVSFPASGGATACAAIITDAAGETRVTVARGSELEAADVENGFRTAIESADALLLNNEVPDGVNLLASEIAEKAGVATIFNPAPARKPPEALARRVKIWTPNETEESALGGVPGEVVATLGAKGCRIRSTGATVPAAGCGRAVDATGAGDTFTGVLAVRLAEGESLEDACRAANAAAAATVSRRGVFHAIPCRKDVERI